MKGGIDEVYLFDEALTAERIETLRTANTGPDRATIVHLPLDEMR